jgi:hypothetical protein
MNGRQRSGFNVSEILFLGIPIQILCTEQRTELENFIARRVTKRQP